MASAASASIIRRLPSTSSHSPRRQHHRHDGGQKKHRDDHHRRQRHRQRLSFLLVFVLLIATLFYSRDLGSSSSSIDDINDSDGPPQERPPGRETAKKNNDKAGGRRRKAGEIYSTRKIRPASPSLETVVRFLTDLAKTPPDRLRNEVLGGGGGGGGAGDGEEDRGEDPFMLRELEAGRCPWRGAEATTRGAEESVVEWLPPRPFDSMDIARAYRDEERTAVIWYEHLSKAGGTTFCSLAQSNMKRSRVPKYHCMPRKGKLMDGRVGSWTNEEFVTHLGEKGHGIVSNEWDPFSLEKLKLSRRRLDGGEPTKEDERTTGDPRALFVTTLRDPLDRLLSVYTFFALTTTEKWREKNNSEAPTFHEWISNNQKRLGNYKVGTKVVFRCNTARYNHIVWRFSGGMESSPLPKKGRGHQRKDASTWEESFEIAIRALSQHDLILPMDIMSGEGLGKAALHDLLGWDDFKASGRAMVGDKEGGHVVTFGGIKNSNARAYFGEEEFRQLWEENWLDNILYLWCRAVFLVRLHCKDVLAE